jgi:YihY family inner membrane protein
MFQRPRFFRKFFGVPNHAPWWQVLGHTCWDFAENDLFTSAAAMSYFGLLTIFPLLLLLLALSNSLAPVSYLLNEMLARVVQVYPGSAEFLHGTLRSLSSVGKGLVITCTVVVLWAGSWVFAVVEHALNRIWNTTSRTFLHGRALTVGMVGLAGLVLSASVLMTSLLVVLQRLAGNLTLGGLTQFRLIAALGGVFSQTVFAIAGVLVTVTLFALIYRFMPNSDVKLRDALPGAILAGLFWEAAKYGFAQSLHLFHYDQLYGPVGAVVAVLTWGYVSSLIMLFGAQLTAVLQREHQETQILPRPPAEEKGE